MGCPRCHFPFTRRLFLFGHNRPLLIMQMQSRKQIVSCGADSEGGGRLLSAHKSTTLRVLRQKSNKVMICSKQAVHRLKVLQLRAHHNSFYNQEKLHCYLVKR